MMTRCQQGLVSTVQNEHLYGCFGFGSHNGISEYMSTATPYLKPKMSQKGEVVIRAQPGSAQGTLTQSLQGLGSLLT